MLLFWFATTVLMKHLGEQITQSNYMITYKAPELYSIHRILTLYYKKDLNEEGEKTFYFFSVTNSILSLWV